MLLAHFRAFPKIPDRAVPACSSPFPGLAPRDSGLEAGHSWPHVVPLPAQTHSSCWLQASCSLAITGDGTTAKGTVTPGAEGRENKWPRKSLQWGTGLPWTLAGPMPGPGEKFMRRFWVQVWPVPQSLLP